MSRVSKKVSDLVYRRDRGLCLHCGSSDVTIQHRKNVGAGGAKKDSPLHQPANLILLCGAYNALIESDPREASIARFYGWKIRTILQAYEEPVFDVSTGFWYRLGDTGSRALTDVTKDFRELDASF